MCVSRRVQGHSDPSVEEWEGPQAIFVVKEASGEGLRGVPFRSTKILNFRRYKQKQREKRGVVGDIAGGRRVAAYGDSDEAPHVPGAVAAGPEDCDGRVQGGGAAGDGAEVRRSFSFACFRLGSNLTARPK